jgi:hypothetical protein
MQDGRIVSDINENFATKVGGMFFAPEGIGSGVPINVSRIPNVSVISILASSAILLMPASRF